MRVIKTLFVASYYEKRLMKTLKRLMLGAVVASLSLSSISLLASTQSPDAMLNSKQISAEFPYQS